MRFLKNSEVFVPLERLFSLYITRYFRYVIISVICMIVVAIATGFSGYMLKPVINKVFIEKSHHKLVQICFFYLAISIVKALASYIQNVLIYFVQDKVVNDIRRDLFVRMISLNINSLTKTKERFVGVFANDVKIISENFTPLVQTMIRDFWSVFALLIVVFYQNLKLACIAFIVFPVALLFLKKMTKNVRQNYKESQIKNDILINSINYVISGIKTIKSYTAENFEIRKFDKVLFHFFKYSFKFKKKGSRGSPFMEVVGGLSTVMVIFYGGISVINGTSDPGSFFSFLVSLIMAYRPAKSLSGFGVKLHACSISTARILELFKEGEIENRLNCDAILNRKDLTQNENLDIKFENVNFSYLKENERETLENINFEIKQGQKIAFVGSSGSGKSTIVDLLMRFSGADSGKITIANQDISNFDVSCIRKNISYVTQDTFLFDQDIHHNITYNTRKTDLSVDEAIDLACIDFHEEEKERGSKNANEFSFGQRQRIGIARAIYKDAPIFILDESTSALDTVTEKKIMDNIFEKCADKTIIIIAHRIHLLPRCDKIYVVDKGKIVEEGNHFELMNQKNIYYKLWNVLMENSNL